MYLVLQNILRFFILILVQIFFLDNIQFIGYISPMIYILFIFSLPARLNKNYVLILAFIIGLTTDMFNNTMGIHAFSSVLIGFLRAAVIRAFVSLDEGENPTPSFRTFGVNNYVKYIITLVFIHHTSLFLLESFSFVGLSSLILKILISSLISILLIFGVQSLKFKK